MSFAISIIFFLLFLLKKRTKKAALNDASARAFWHPAVTRHIELVERHIELAEIRH